MPIPTYTSIFMQQVGRYYISGVRGNIGKAAGRVTSPVVSRFSSPSTIRSSMHLSLFPAALLLERLD